MSCPSVNTPNEGEDCFFCPEGIHWDAHRIGWAVAGGCAAATVLVTLFTLTMHATHYQQPAAQKQVMRVLLMPPVYAVVSFFSYRYYREYEYYILAETAYEAITLSAFLMLLMELVAMSTADRQIKSVLAEKDKKKLPFPFNCWRFRASKPYFMHALSFSVMQYVILRPLISVAGIVCEYYKVLCPGKYSPRFAAVYLEAVDFVSISIALYGLIVFYVLCKDELKGRKPLNKFLAIKLIVFFTFYQSFVFSVLQNYDVIKATEFWTADNVSDGLSALCTTVEMVIFSIYMGWAYSWKEYTDPKINPHQRRTGARTYFAAIWDTINLADFGREIWLALKFFVGYMLGRPGTHSQPTKLQQTFMAGENANEEGQEKLPVDRDSRQSPSASQRWHELDQEQKRDMAYGQLDDGYRGYDSRNRDLAPSPADATAAAVYAASMKRNPNGSYRDSAYGSSYATPVARPPPSVTPTAAFPSARPTGTYPGGSQPISHGDWQASQRSDADRYGSRSFASPGDGQRAWHSHASRYQAQTGAYDGHSGVDEYGQWRANRPASYSEDQGIPGNPRLY